MLEKNWSRAARACALGITMHFSASLGAASQSVGSAMQDVYTNFEMLFSLSADSEAFADAANQAEITHAFTALLAQSEAIADHATREPMELMARELNLGLWFAQLSFRWRRYEAARVLVFSAIDVCAACHTRFPVAKDSLLPGGWPNDSVFRALSGWERAKLEIATRRFERALETLERYIISEPAQSGLWLEACAAYVRVSLRSEGGTSRAAGFLAALSRDQSLGYSRARLLQAWQRAYRGAEEALAARASDAMQVARAHIARAEGVTSETGLVDYAIAGVLLEGYLDSAATDSEHIAQASYWLGLSEYRANSSRWFSQPEYHFENAIRHAPGSDLAKASVALLLEHLLSLYEVPRPAALPDEIQQHLALLEQLADGE